MGQETAGNFLDNLLHTSQIHSCLRKSSTTLAANVTVKAADVHKDNFHFHFRNLHINFHFLPEKELDPSHSVDFF